VTTTSRRRQQHCPQSRRPACFVARLGVVVVVVVVVVVDCSTSSSPLAQALTMSCFFFNNQEVDDLFRKKYPRWRLNRNWEVLTNIQSDIANNELEITDPATDPLAEFAQKQAARCLLEFTLDQEYHRKPLLQQAKKENAQIK
jgi:hypothetical protein